MKLHALLKTIKMPLWSYIIIIILGYSTNVNAQFAGGAGTPTDPYQISNVTQLQAMNSALDKHFVLTQNIDASITNTWNGGAGFEPIGATPATAFSGTFDGKGFVISKLFINRPGVQGIGLIGNYLAFSGAIQNVGLDSVNISGGNRTGALIGNKQGTVRNCYSSGIVTGSGTVGGLIGRNGNSELSNSYSSCTVSGNNEVGGLSGSGSFIIDCYASGNVTSSGTVGGLIGEISSAGGNVKKSYSTGTVTTTGASSSAGGLIGRVQVGNIDLCYSSSTVNGNMIGGLIGLSNNGNITRCYSTSTLNSNGGLNSVIAGLIAENEYKVSDCYANVKINYTGASSGVYLGGLIGENSDHAEVTNTYAVVTFTGANGSKGGLVGINEASLQDTAFIKNSYWNTDSSGAALGIHTDQSTGQIVTGLTSAQMRLGSSFPLWNFDTVWAINEGSSFPYFKTQGGGCANTFADDSVRACDTYTWINGMTYTSNNDTSTFILPNAAGCDSIITLKLIIDTINTGVSLNLHTLSAAANNANATYQWIDCANNSAINNATSSTYTATSNGSYAVVISNGTCIDTSVCTNVVVSGINSSTLKEIKVYPNPSTSEINFELTSNAQVQLIDALGRIVFTDILDAGVQKIKLTNFSNGMYLLSIKDFESHYITRIILSK